MSCTCDSNDLELGTEEGGLTLRVRPGERAAPSLVLMQADPAHPNDPAYDTPIAWPSAPVMIFDDFTVTADLAPSDAPLDVVADALATWTITPEQTATLVDFAAVRISVDDETWWSGRVACQS